MKGKMPKYKVIFITLILLIMSGFTALSVYAANNVVARFDTVNFVADPGETVPVSLIIEGLGTDPEHNQISSISFTSSNPDVVDSISPSFASAYTADGSSVATGLCYTVSAQVKAIGSTKITATVTDVGGKDYTCSCIVIGKGIIVSPKDVTLEVGESCVLFAERYGFNSNQAVTLLRWNGQPNEGSVPGWISMGTRENNRQNEAYYVKGETTGLGTVMVSLQSSYTDTVNVTVVPKKSITIKNGSDEITSPIELNSINDTVDLNAATVGFTAPNVTWTSSHPQIVSISSASGDMATIKREAYSDVTVAISATATEDGITRRKTFNVKPSSAPDPYLKITSIKAESDGTVPPRKSITIKEGETFTLSTLSSGIESTATTWSATTDGGRVPLVLNSTVGKSITLEGRSRNGNNPIVVTASNGGLTDSVYVTVLPGEEEKGVRIISERLGADKVIVLSSDERVTLQAELMGLSETASVKWSAYVAQNNEVNSGSSNNPMRTNAVNLSMSAGPSTTITAGVASTSFAKIVIEVEDEGKPYTDEVYVKYTGSSIISSARYIELFNEDKVTLKTTDGSSVKWESNSPKTYLGDSHPTNQSPTSTVTGSSATLTADKTQSTRRPSLITAEADGEQKKDSAYVYVSSKNYKWQTLSFHLNGGYGTTPETRVVSSKDTVQSIMLTKPDAAYPSGNGDYEFYGWSEYSDADVNTNAIISKPIFFPGQVYTIPSGKDIKLYAIWTKKSEDALFVIRTNDNIGPEYGAENETPSTSGIYLRGALNQAEPYYNVGGVGAHLTKMPSDADIGRIMNLQYKTDLTEPLGFDPDHDRVIWYKIRKLKDDAAGNPIWHVEGTLVRSDRVSLTYDPNLNVANISKMPNPPRSFYNVGDSVGITGETPLCKGALFVGWNTEADGSGNWYNKDVQLYQGVSGQAETSINITEDTTLYAIWKVSDYQLDRTCYAPDVTSVYDGRPHGIKVTVSNLAKNVTIRYGETEGVYNLSESPTITKVSESGKVVYYRVTSDSFETITGSATITIKKAPMTIKANNKKITYGDAPPDFGVEYSGFVNGETKDTTGLFTGTLEINCSYKQGDDAGSYAITPSGLSAANYEISYIPGTLTVSKVDSEVTPPKAIDNLKETGSDLALVSAGTVKGGSMSYCLGTDDETVPTSGWIDEIPTAAKAGSWYVWYKVTGDKNHLGKDPACITVVIGEGDKKPEESEPEENKPEKNNPEESTPEESKPEENEPEENKTQPVLVSKITLQSPYKKIYKGDRFTLKATVLPSNAENKSVKWKTGNGKIATVDQNGNVTVKKAGKVTITATSKDEGKVVGTYTFTAKKATLVTGIKLNYSKATLNLKIKAKRTIKLTATLKPDKATNKKVIWTSSNTKVATLSSTGKVTAKKAGSATITATTVNGGKKAKCRITVKK